MFNANKNLTGNDRFEGFCIELIREIAGIVGFHYTIRLTPEAKYGIFNPDTGEWNGIVRELMDRVLYHCTIQLLLEHDWFLFFLCSQPRTISNQ